MSYDPSAPVDRALRALDGLSIGDALGERFFGPPDRVLPRIAARALPPPPWRYTDDTEMALSVVDVLQELGRIDPPLLARRFAERYDDTRGYGGGAHDLLQQLRRGVPWQVASRALFDGRGSYGNGAAMRVAPLGAWFATDLEHAAAEAELSAEVTHAHPEGIAGAVAVSIAAACAWQQRRDDRLDGPLLLREVVAHTPAGRTRDRLARAQALAPTTTPEDAARELGSGQEVAAFDTVPFAIWSAAHHLTSFEEAFWATVGGLGDRDTTCAMACGIVALSADGVPAAWLSGREALPITPVARPT